MYNNEDNFLDYVDEHENAEFFKEYGDYLRCRCSKKYVIEPLFCYQCNRTYCKLCICGHDVPLNVNFKTILSSFKFKCKNVKNGCHDIVPYEKLKTHRGICKKQRHSFRDKDLKDFKSNTIDVLESLKERNEKNLKQDLLIKTDTIYCPSCTNKIEDRSKILDHIAVCVSIQTDLFENHENKSILSTFNGDNNSLHLINDIKQLKDLYYKKSLSLTKNHVNTLSSLIGSICKGGDQFNFERKSSFEISRELLDYNHKYYKEKIDKLKKEVNDYKLKNIELKSEIANKFNEVDNLTSAVDFQCVKKVSSLVSLVDAINSKLSREKVEDKYKVIKVEECFNCAVCGDKSGSKISKYFCNLCRKYFCINKCIQKCQNRDCLKIDYMCPFENSPCSLCRKLDFCNDCKKRCFYESCKNAFCPDCFKKNEHQTRSSNISCTFFTCERDKTVTCLMTSLYCGKCELRLCNDCLHKEKTHEHFK